MTRVQLACLISFGTGFLSLSQEILFVRLVGFAFFSTPEAFAYVLTCFLLGIAMGAAVGKRVCAAPFSLLNAAAATLVVSSLVDVLVPLLAEAAIGSFYAPLAVGSLIVLVAALKSVLFPIAHQMGAEIESARIGRSISRVYTSNIAGSSLGPLVTGFWLLDHVGTEQAFLLVAAGMSVLATITLGAAIGLRVAWFAATSVIALATALAFPSDLIRDVAQRTLRPEQRLGDVLERRSGIVHTATSDVGGAMVFGGNVYDGRINTSLLVNSNSIDRVYLLRLLHPKPERVLVIGLSTGAWARALGMFPDVRHVDVVEVNPAYLDLIERHEEVRALLTDPRFKVHIDDGRRWLRQHADARYDLIVMNTTFHWRAYATNLLSAEFLAMARSRLSPGGVFVFNTTGSPDVAWTAASVFPFVRLYLNAAYCADHDFTVGLQTRAGYLYELSDQGRPLFQREDPRDLAAIESLASVQFVTAEARRRHAGRVVDVVTDDNMITEFRHGRPRALFPGS